MATTTTKTDERTQNAQMIAGAQAKLESAGPFTINGTSYTTAQAIARIAQRNTLLDNATSARAQEHTAVLAEQADRPGWTQFINAFRAIVQAMFAADMATLQLFDITPRKKATKTTAIKAVAVAKMRATRVARHTLGKKARLAVKGTVTPPAPTPAPAPTQATQTAAPAPAPQTAAPSPAPHPAPVVAAPPPVESATATSSPATSAPSATPPGENGGTAPTTPHTA